MIEIVLLLLGARVVRRKWWIVALAGSVWLILGAYFLYDSFLDTRLSGTWFAIPMLIEAAVSAFGGVQTGGTERSLRFGKAILLVLIALVVVEAPWHEDMIVGILAGIVLVTSAIWRATTAYLVRFARWHWSIAGAAFEFLMGLWSFIPWPTDWAGEAEGDIGLVMVAASGGILAIALRLRLLPPDIPLSTVLSDGWPTASEEDIPLGQAPWKAEHGSITVHIWTPTGALVPVGVRRYIAAVNEGGGVSAGHAALDVPPDVYISHYPAVEISRSRSEFTKTLRATPDNDVVGLFQPSYLQESAEWCPSTMQVQFDGVDVRAIRHFWRGYRRDTTYNLTNRNCSSAIAKALDAGIEGLFEHRAASPYFLWRLLFLPELWIAGMLRRRAAAMAWTPGLMLDYARGLSYVVRLRQTLAEDRRQRAKAAA